MTKFKSRTSLFVIIGFIFSIFINNSAAQINLHNTKLHESKTFSKNQIQIIQSLYLDEQGIPSHEMFKKTNGIFPTKQEFESVPYFTVSFLKDEVLSSTGDYIFTDSMELMNLDFYIETISKYNSINNAVPIWDGRVYEDANNLIVGGYSSEFNERPVGKINNKGLFVPLLDGVHSKEFPILKIPTEKIIFDPFEWKLLQLKPNVGGTIQNSSSSFLPLNIYNIKGELLSNVSFEIESNHETSMLVLYGIMDGGKFEIANCNLNTSTIVNNRDAFQPELIEGSSQPGKGPVITITFHGIFSNNISHSKSELYLNSDTKYLSVKQKAKPSSISIDGNFGDWRNISGVTDFKGDYVSYLFDNPDTDLLEFKVTNDDKYLYLYSRVVGVHGRTGEGGRYYWYSYIDVDRNGATGYPPTRDDNCYFGIPIGDDSEAQFEFIDNKFVKTFFGFTGIGAEEEVLSGVLELGPSYYAPKGRDGKKRDNYKIEYVKRNDKLFITHDYTEGTSDNIIIALSPDGSEVEVRVELDGFLKDHSGTMLMYKGKTIDIAVGVESSSNHYGSDDWGADSSPTIYGYEIK